MDVPPQTTDSCVLRAWRMAEENSVKVLSLDVFDTLLWRVVPEPIDAFLLVGRSLADAGHLRVPVEAFARLREVAEHRARERSLRRRSTPEVSLAEVYEELSPNVVGDAVPADLADLEVEVERSITFPDLEVVQFARAIQAARGVRVVLVSNTYFSAEQLRRILDREAFRAIDVDGVFTSSDNGRHKGSGLYDAVLDVLGVAAADVLHLGDDPDADGACAERAGMHAALLPRRPEPLPIVLEREGLLRGDVLRRPRAPLQDGAGDFGLTALRGKALRRVEGDTLSSDLRPWWAAGVGVFGPVLTGFAEWVHDRATAVGVDRVFCVMREGHFLAPLLDAARSLRGSGAETATIWLSRFVCSQAAIVEVSEDEIEAFLRRRRAPTVAEACQSLGITPVQVGLDEHGADRLTDARLRRRFLLAVTGRDEVRRQVQAHCSQARRRLVEHVVGTVGAREGWAVLVDLGWGATIQASLDAALRAEGVELRTQGLYLLTNDAAVDRVLDGVAAEGFLGNLGLPDPDIRWIMRSPEALEQLCMPEVGSLAGFDTDGRPLTTPSVEQPIQRAQREAVRDGVLAFQKEWGRYRDVLPADQRALTGAGRALLRKTLLRFVVEPTEEEASTFGSWAHDENWGSDGSETLLTGMTAEKLEHMSPLQLLELPMDRLYWPFAVAALHHPSLARAAAALASGALPADVFSGDQASHVTLYVDYGGGLFPRRQPSVAPNGRGLYYVRERVDAHPLRAIAVEFPPGPGLVRLDSMRLYFELRGRSDPAVVDIRWPTPSTAVRYDGELLSGNLLLGERRSPRVSYECPPEWGVDVHCVEVELGFGWLPSAGGARPGRDRAALALELARRAYPRAQKMYQLGKVLLARARAL